MMKKTIAAGTIALMLAAGVGVALAQSAPPRDDARAPISAEDAAAFTDARIAGLKAGLKKLADASEPLYKSLDDGQKRRFGALLRMGGRAGMEHRFWQRRTDNAR